MNIELKSKQFCQDILGMDVPHSKALTNVVMSLSSHQGAQSPVELSTNPIFHYQYSSICDAVSNLSVDAEDWSATQQEVQRTISPYLPANSDKVVLQTDTTPVRKPHSPTLAQRHHIAVPNNVIAGNKPLSIGYEVSFINMSVPGSKWTLPLNVKRVDTEQTATQCALEQLKQLQEKDIFNFSEKLIINTLDSKYGNAYYLAPAHQYDNLVSNVRLRSGIKVWEPDTTENKKIYGTKYYLNRASQTKIFQNHPKTKQPYEVFQRSILEKQEDEYFIFESVTEKGRAVSIELWRWNNMLIRTKNGNNMKDKPFHLIHACVKDKQTQKLVFDREMFIAIAGKRKDEVTLKEAFADYRHRSDIEPQMRFVKQKLMIEKFKTPLLKNFDNWLLIIQLSLWLLFTASDEVEFVPQKWEKYLPQNKDLEKKDRLSLSQTQRALQSLFLTFDSTPFLPKKSKSGKPRQKGEFQPKRERHKIVKKSVTKTNKTLTLLPQIRIIWFRIEKHNTLFS